MCALYARVSQRDWKGSYRGWELVLFQNKEKNYTPTCEVRALVKCCLCSGVWNICRTVSGVNIWGTASSWILQMCFMIILRKWWAYNNGETISYLNKEKKYKERKLRKLYISLQLFSLYLNICIQSGIDNEVNILCFDFYVFL